MSRTGKKPIALPEKVDVKLEGLSISVKGPKGQLQRTLPDGITLSKNDNSIVVKPLNENDNFKVTNEAYTDSGVIINSKFLNNLNKNLFRHLRTYL